MFKTNEIDFIENVQCTMHISRKLENNPFPFEKHNTHRTLQTFIMFIIQFTFYFSPDPRRQLNRTTAPESKLMTHTHSKDLSTPPSQSSTNQTGRTRPRRRVGGSSSSPEPPDQNNDQDRGLEQNFGRIAELERGRRL